MSDAIKELHDYLAKSPSVVYPEDVLAYLSAIEAENAKLRKVALDMHTLATDEGVYVRYPYCDAWDEKLAVVEKQMHELGLK